MKTFTRQIGAIELTTLADGEMGYDFERLCGRFPNVPPNSLREVALAAGTDPDAQTTYFNTALIKASDTLILVDAGNQAGATVACLASLGVKPEDIDILLITHAHGDHIAGLLEADGSTLRYPNARHLINRAEWDFWLAREQAPFGAILRKVEARIEFVDLETPIVNGVQPIPLYGHTVGQVGLRIESGGETLIHAADLVHSETQFAQPDWTIKFDTDPDQARATRHALFAQLADEGTTTLFYHMPFPAIGNVTRAGAAYAWQPIGDK